MENEQAYFYWLYSISGIGNKTIKILKKYVGEASAIYKLSPHDLSWFLNERQLSGLVESRKHWDIINEYEKLARQGISFYPDDAAGYPEKLRVLPDPPAALFVKGNLPEPALPAVALIGTRKCSGYGSAMAKELGRALALRGILVTSGMARGIDGIAQRAVCEAGGATFAVLGCGADIIYPAENKKLYEQIPERGGIISEYVPGTRPHGSLFPPRNRIISGLADAVVVVEAREKSGTMITVDMALEQGREVYALPGRTIDGLSAGCNRLIRQGAGLVTSVAEFADEILAEAKRRLTGEVIALKQSGKMAPAGAKQSDKPGANNLTAKFAEFTEEEKQVLACLDYTPRSLEEIRRLCPRIAYERLLKILVTFCLGGTASQMGAGNYCLKA